MNISSFLEYKLLDFLNYSLSVYQLLLIFVFIFATQFLLIVFKKLLFRAEKKHFSGDKRFLSVFQLIKYTVWGIVFILILQILGVNLTILLAGSAALLVGLGFGLKQIFEDFFSGIIILIDGTIKVNDVVEVDNIVGKVLDIKLRFTRILTRDDIILIIPNHIFVSEKVINWSHSQSSTRFNVEVGVEYGSDVEMVKTVLVECAKINEAIHNKPPFHPFVRFNEFSDSSLVFQLFFWTDEAFRVEQIKSNLRFQIYSEFSKAGITIAYPQRDIHIKSMPQELNTKK
jgi:small-conductance mechanosensitive channel